MTPAALRLINDLESEAMAADAITDTDAPYMAREKAASRRDGIRWVLSQMRSALPDIEDEAVTAAEQESLRLDAILESVR